MFDTDNRYVEHLNVNNYSEYELFKEAMDFISKRKYNVAYRIICKWKIIQPVKEQGLGCKWELWYKTGLSKLLLKESKKLVKEINDPLISTATLYALYSGTSNRNVACMLIKYFLPNRSFDDVFQDIRYSSCILSTNINFAAYIECKIETYQFLATLDERTCPVCGELDGKIYPVKERQIGKNCPPMHKNCRCTTVSTIGIEHGINMQRSAIDPATGKRIKVPRSMNWKEWKKYYKQ